MSRELQSLEILFNGEADFITDRDTFQRTTMLASNSLLTIIYLSPLTSRNARVETVPFNTTTYNA
jgi:hypothetical protein